MCLRRVGYTGYTSKAIYDEAYTDDMSELKTRKSDDNVLDFLQSIDNNQRRKDATELLTIFGRATNMKPAMWGNNIIGYGQYHYKSERSSQEGDWPLTGFSPRKATMTVYIMPGFEKYRDDLTKLGKHKTSVSCIYFNKLSDIDAAVLERIISDSVAEMKRQYSV